MYECKKCGYKTEEKEIKTCPECNEELVEVAEEQAAEPKKKKGLIGVLVIVIILVVSTFLIEYISSKPEDRAPTEEEIREDMSVFVENVANYTPGAMTDNGYESEYWGIRISLDNHWEKLPEENLKDMEEKESAMTRENTQKMIEEKEFSQSLEEEFSRTIYCCVESGFNYIKDYRTTGVMYIDVVAAYMGRNVSEEDLEKSVIDEYAAAFENAKTGECTLGEEKYSYVDTAYHEGDKTTNMRVYVNVKGSMIQRIKLMYEDKSEEVIKSFESSVEKY